MNESISIQFLGAARRVFVAIIVLTMLAQIPRSFGRPVRAREQFGTIQEVDVRTRRLTIDVGRDSEPLALVWNSSTWFVEGIHFTSVERLKRGMQVVVYYHSPFFGDRYATKILVRTRSNDGAVPAASSPGRKVKSKRFGCRWSRESFSRRSEKCGAFPKRCVADRLR